MIFLLVLKWSKLIHKQTHTHTHTHQFPVLTNDKNETVPDLRKRKWATKVTNSNVKFKAKPKSLKANIKALCEREQIKSLARRQNLFRIRVGQKMCEKQTTTITERKGKNEKRARFSGSLQIDMNK